MAFPVLLFHYFNQPAYFEKYVIEKKREMYAPEDEKTQKGMENVIRFIKQRDEQKALKAIEEFEAQQKSQASQSAYE